MEAQATRQALGSGNRSKLAGWLLGGSAQTGRPEASVFSSAARIRLLLACWVVLVGVQIITPLWYATADTCCYLSIARSLAHGETPTNLGSRNLIFGIGYPAVIAPAFLLSATPFLLVTAINAALATAYLAGVVVWARRYAPAAAGRSPCWRLAISWSWPCCGGR